MAIAAAAIGIALRESRWRHDDRHAIASGSLTRLTSTPGLDTDPALSPDGSFVAYASDRHDGSSLDIWVQPVAGGDATRLTSDPGDEAEPAFSPDGKWIVYAKREDGGIYVVPTSGGEPHALIQEVRPRTPQYSPDGKWVLYWTGQPVWNERSGNRAAGTLKVVSAQGGAPRIVASNIGSSRFGIWAPDSLHILFLGDEDVVGDGTLDWYLASREGVGVRTGALTVLHDHGVPGAAVPGAWDPSDASVVFSTTGNGESNLWKVGVDATNGHITGTPQRLTFGTAIERSPVLARDGRVALASVSENVDIWRVRLDPVSGVAAGAWERITSDAAEEHIPSVSDDGRLLVYVRSHGGRDALWLRDLVTGRERHIADGELISGRISPDATTLAIGPDDGRSGIVLMPTLGDATTAVCDQCGLGAWSPDGSRIVIRRGRPSRLYVRDVRSGAETPLASHPEWNLLQPRFSPDGRWVVFHTTNSVTLRQIYAVPVTGRAVPFEEWVPIVTDFGIQPSWAEDGRGVYHFSLRDGAFCAWLQPVDSKTMRPLGAPRAVQHLHEPRLRATTAATVTNDVHGGYLYATLTETTGNIWMLHGGATALRATR
jgi:Tol biopolymer transport system component